MKGFLLSVLFTTILFSPVNARNYDKVQIKTIKVENNVYMLIGAGGNIGISTGADGIFMIDDQFAPLTEKIKGAVAAISDRPIRFLINTHWHYDHTGGNEKLGKMGSIIIAHENVRKRLSTEQFISFFKAKVPPKAKSGLPVISFTRDVTFHINEDEIHVFHVANAHTDGDAIIHFRKNNVIHMGDIFFSGMYPFVDLDAGGSVNGIIDAIKKVLPKMDESTKVIPGHSPLSTKSQLKAYLGMLTTLRDRIRKEIKAGKSLETIVATRPTKDLDPEWNKGIIKGDAFVKILYQDLSRR
ncbi:MAG: MBL fold metallo-hydrolase [Deltaproteobacteria bacterium]|nr:MAG: MBL fold metallo-hydrolase [Deltaproteobacteria bacterium]